MPQEFKVGDIVQLKSGGPKMTVNFVNESLGWIGCVWFAGAKHEDARFSAEALILAPEEKSRG